MINTKLSSVDMLFKFTIVFHLLSYFTSVQCQSIFLLVSKEQRIKKESFTFLKPYDLPTAFLFEKSIATIGQNRYVIHLFIYIMVIFGHLLGIITVYLFDFYIINILYL